MHVQNGIDRNEFQRLGLSRQVVTQAYGSVVMTYTFQLLYSVKYMCTRAKSLQLCLTLRNPMDYSLPGSSVHRILQVRILEWVAMPSSRGSFQPRDQTHIFYVSCIGRQVLYHQDKLEVS